ncbi:MAG: DUF3857 and transglutaminase domain-containing protein [Candidatus Riflebacteria bacterium]|nr:DUF3857 and transglutaminase domain-containing protein [Candidatus Riflebacteria bacterium]
MKKIRFGAFLIAYFFLISIVFGSALIEFRDGQQEKSQFEFNGNEVTLGNGKKVPKTDILSINFSAESDSSGSTQIDDKGEKEAMKIASDAVAFEKKYPDAAGIILLDDTRYIYNKDGGWTEIAHFIGKIKKEERMSWADQSIFFTEGRDRVKFHFARCIKPDGTVLSANPSEAKVSKPQISPGIFMKYLSSTLRVPKPEIGSIIDVEYELETYNPYNREFFFPSDYFQSNDPILKSCFTITIPKDKQLFWEARNFPPSNEKPEEKSQDGSKTYRWELNEVDPLVEEPLMPKGADALPYVQGSLFEGWDKIYDWINKYWVPNTTPNPELASKTLEIVKGLNTEEEKIAKIYHWIQKNIRYIIIKGDAGTVYGSYPAYETVQKQFGCCVDKAIVFSAMLNVLGIKNGPLLINATSHDISKRIPNLSITHSISRITRSNCTDYYLDSTSYDYRYPSFGSFDQGRLCVDPFKRAIDLIPMQKPDENRHVTMENIVLSLDGTIKVKIEKRSTGEMEAGSRGYLKSLKPEEREKFYSQRINGYGKGAKLLSLKLQNLEDVEKEFWYTLSYEIPSYPREIADLMVFPVPGFLNGLTFPEAGFATRTYPIEYESTWKDVEEGKIELDNGLEIRSLPEPEKIDGKFFTFEGKFEKIGTSTISFRAVFESHAKRVPLADYETFKADVKRIQKFARERIFLSKRAREESK